MIREALAWALILAGSAIVVSACIRQWCYGTWVEEYYNADE